MKYKMLAVILLVLALVVAGALWGWLVSVVIGGIFGAAYFLTHRKG